MKHANIAIFVPHAGCPQKCSFCDQTSISGRKASPTAEDVRSTIERAVKHLPTEPTQIAFFGGSFTAMDQQYMLSLLQNAQTYIDGTVISGIRVSTRPDAVSLQILDMLIENKVTDIELGAQSMDNEVLMLNLRGHSSEDTITASRLIKACNIRLGLQMMTGLYTDKTDTTLNTARKIAELKPDYVRIYPTLVLKNTMLEKLYTSGDYAPQTLEEAVTLCSKLLAFFTEQGIPVIRLGLHDSPDLLENYVAGPYHPAFRELCESKIMLEKVVHDIEKRQIPKGKLAIYVASGCVSKMTGQKRANMLALERMGYSAKVFKDDSMRYLETKII